METAANTYSAAPTTDSETAKLMPVVAHMYGEVDVRNQPTLMRSPLPVSTWYITDGVHLKIFNELISQQIYVESHSKFLYK